MTAVSPTASTTGTGATLASQSATSASSSVSDTQQTFLKLLVTQMQNQDPLNPMDNAQVTSQLAQLSTVDGINQLNTTLQGMASVYADTRSMQAAGLIGRSVLAQGSQLTLQNGTANGGVDLSQAVDDLVVTVRDPAGNVQNKIDLGAQAAGVVPFQWNGQKADGTTAPSGKYTFSVQATQGGNSVDATSLGYATVGSVTLGAQDTTLNTDSLGGVALSQVKQIF